MTALSAFRRDTRAWLSKHCPRSMRRRMVPGEHMNGGRQNQNPDPAALEWQQKMAERGWTAPTWPQEYGGAGLSAEEFVVLLEELARIKARPPLGGMGVTMIGPTLLEYGNDEQRRRHLPQIARGEVSWCQGYSEPGAGSDLASLKTAADDHGDHYLVNGSKIWTSGAHTADWIFCLVRTDRDAPKHRGISFLLFSMDSPGVTTRPIEMLNGNSPFCQTFFDNVEVPKVDLVHRENEGWSVAKRLLQHERSGLAALASGATAGALERIKPSVALPELARRYVGDLADSDPALRDEILANEMTLAAYLLTQARTIEERATETPGPATSIFKYVEANYVKRQLELQLRLRGSQGLGWEGPQFDDEEKSMCRLWLEAKSISIAGGSNEVQLNIIAKRVLGLPD
ncbi:MAG: acyl-CoA dehydrogenase family protein [Pseudomonadota bacterium]